MRRLLALLVLPLVVGLAACDRTDEDFGDDGIVRIELRPETMTTVPGGAEAADVFVLGHRPNTDRVAVSSMHADGTTSWTTELPDDFRALQPDGAVAHWRGTDPDLSVFVVSDDGRVAQLDADGALVESYGDDGVASTGVAFDAGSYPVVVATDDGAATVVGRFEERPVLARLTVDGHVDETFGVGGVLRIDQDVSIAEAAQLDDGRVLVAGTKLGPHSAYQPSFETDFAVLRVTRGGRLDPTFGFGGVATVSFNDIDGAGDLGVRPDGRIVLAGSTTPDESLDTRLAFAGLTANGAPDSTFGLYARSIVDIDDGNVWSGPQLAVGGPGFVALAEVNDVLVTVGLTQQGTLEDSWGEHGFQRNRVSDRMTDIGDLAMVGDARFLVAARTWAGPGGALLGLKP